MNEGKIVNGCCCCCCGMWLVCVCVFVRIWRTRCACFVERRATAIVFSRVGNFDCGGDEGLRLW